MDTGSLTVQYLKPGALLFHNRSMLVNTNVGHGVVVTLYDPKKEIGAICHFAFPRMDDDETPTGLFAKPAIFYLVRLMKRAGSSISDLEATISGGAMLSPVYKAHQNLAKQNIKKAIELLSELNIHVVKRDIGGYLGRKVQFNTGNGDFNSSELSALNFGEWFPGFNEVKTVDFPVLGVN